MKFRRTQVTCGTGRCQFKICVRIQSTHVCQGPGPGLCFPSDFLNSPLREGPNSLSQVERQR